MRLWRLTREPFVALDGMGAAALGARWTSPGQPVVNFTIDPGLAVLIALRYLPRDLHDIDRDYVLGWTETDATPERLPFVDDQVEKRRIGDEWLQSGRCLFACVRSAVLPECDLVLMNPVHPDAASVAPLTTRPFDFAQCLRLPESTI